LPKHILRLLLQLEYKEVETYDEGLMLEEVERLRYAFQPPVFFLLDNQLYVRAVRKLSGVNFLGLIYQH
jgi:hypothetical protein